MAAAKSDEIKAQMTAKTPTDWADRITHYGKEAPDQLLAHPLNAFKIHPRHQQNAMEGTLDELGWLSPILVSERSGMIIDGHMRAQAAISRGQTSVPVAYLDLSPEEEPLALATYDQIGALVAFDKENLDLLLQDLNTPGDAAVQEMLADLALDGERITLGDVEEGNERHLGDKFHQVTAVLYVEQIDVFEAALRATGNVNRAEAMMEICKVYLADHEEG